MSLKTVTSWRAFHGSSLPKRFPCGNADPAFSQTVRAIGCPNGRFFAACFYPLGCSEHRDDDAALLPFPNSVKRLPAGSLVNQRIAVSILALGSESDSDHGVRLR